MLTSQLQINKTELVVDNGCVVAQQPIAAQVGASVLAEGGNAIDAAVAAALALAVVEPMMCGLGGGGALLVHLARENHQAAIDFLPRLPAAARPELFELDPARGAIGMYGWPAVKNDANLRGYRAAAVPGAIAGLCRALEKWGTRPLKTVIDPAIALAQEGFVADWFISATIAAAARQMRNFPDTANVFLPDGLPPEAPTRTYVPVSPLRQPDLAATLERIAQRGAAEFYHGETARLLVDAMKLNGGLITAEDLASYRPLEFERLTELNYRGFTLATVPSPCGATTMFEALNILEGFDLRGAGFQSARALHLIAEAQRLAFQDRFAHLSDPSLAQVPIETLLSKEYAARRRALIDERRALSKVTAGDPSAFAGQKSGPSSVRTPNGDPGCTTHLCVIDRERNMVSLTYTLLDLWGSYVTIPGAGVLLNDGIAWFDPEPGKINSIGPNKRPLWAGSMTLAFRDGHPYIAVGAPGGRKIVSAILQTLVNIIDHDKGPQEAIAAPRIHSEGPLLFADSRFPAPIVEQLTALGHQVELLEDTYLMVNFARPVAILIDPATGKLRSGVDVLRPATAVGF